MELKAALEALWALPPGSEVTLYSDSMYLVNGMSEWSAKWKKCGWKKSPNATEQVKNADLWQELDAAASRHRVTWQWVRGHSGVPGNERADRLAARGLQDSIGRELDAEAWGRLEAF